MHREVPDSRELKPALRGLPRKLPSLEPGDDAEGPLCAGTKQALWLFQSEASPICPSIEESESRPTTKRQRAGGSILRGRPPIKAGRRAMCKSLHIRAKCENRSP